MDIHRSSIKDFIMPKVKSVVVIDYYEGIQGLLKSREEFPYDNFLANPRVRTQNEIIWATDSFKEKPTLLTDIEGTLKEQYAYAIKERIKSIESLIEVLKQEEGGAPLSELLSKAISYIDERSVYCCDGNVVVVNWGLIPRSLNLGTGCIYKSGKFVANLDLLHDNPCFRRQHTTQPITEIHPSEVIMPTPVIEPQSQSVIDDIVVPAQEPSHESVDVIVPQNDGVVPKIQYSQLEKDDQTEDEIQKPGQEKSVLEEETPPQQEEQDQGKPVNIAKDHNFSPQKNDYTWGTLGNEFWKGLKFIMRKLWWLVLLILILITLLFCCRGCQGPISQINPFYSPLPKTPIILPIQNDAVGMSVDGKVQIATDRLNILLDKKDDNTMIEFAKAFKKAYPQKDYYIFYYNEDLYNLQIKVPSEERERVKNDIQNKLRDFSFDVFDEIVFKSEDCYFNDPELQNTLHSWYIKEIGAYNAWDITAGDTNIVVAVVDNGFDITHPEFSGKVVHPYNVLTQNTILRPVITKDGENAHGTHVAATAVGNCNNGNGLVGIAPNCRLLPVQVGNDNPDGSMSNQAVMEGVMYAINQGADVINISLGMYTPEIVKTMSEGEQLNYISTSLKQEELMWEKIFDKAKQKNCIIVFAAGNDDVVSGIDPKKRNNETIRVSALNKELSKAYFSNYGVYPELNRTYSTISAPGVSIYSAAPHNNYVTMQGTSMAAPIISGAVALMKSLDKKLSSKQIINILQKTGKNVGNNIGPQLQLYKALLSIKGESSYNGKCEDIEKRIALLQSQIDSLMNLCPSIGTPQDTLRFKDASKDKHGLDGLWKTTASLVSPSDNSPIELYMQFDNLAGTLTIINKDEKYKARLTASIEGEKIIITQHGVATNGRNSFQIYKYVCTSDRRGYLSCMATSDDNSLSFNLIRVK